MRYRVFDTGKKWGKFPFVGYFAGWIDAIEDGIKSLRNYRAYYPQGEFELHEFKNDKFVRKIEIN